MAVDKNENIFQKVRDFFWQNPKDKSYEDKGGDDRVPDDQRTSDPLADANRYATEIGEEPPYPEHDGSGVGN